MLRTSSPRGVDINVSMLHSRVIARHFVDTLAHGPVSLFAMKERGPPNPSSIQHCVSPVDKPLKTMRCGNVDGAVRPKHLLLEF